MKRYWISFEESWIKAFLVDVKDGITIEEVEKKSEEIWDNIQEPRDRSRNANLALYKHDTKRLE